MHRADRKNACVKRGVHTRRPQYDEADERAGAYVLRTSHVDWDIETILRTYWRITDIEATFRSLKSELGLRPIWHQLDPRPTY